MDILQIQALIAKGKVVSIADIDPTQAFVQIGVYQPDNRKIGSSNTTYPSVVIALSELGGTPTLQQVLDNNHDLVDGNNFQGTGAGVGNTGSEVNALGTNAGSLNTKDYLNAIGYRAAYNNSGTYVNAFGPLSASSNTGDNVNAFGQAAAQNNTGDNVNAFGNSAGVGNTLSGMTIFQNTSMPSYFNYAAAAAAITVGLGAIVGNTYLYYDQTTKSIGAVRL
jgi:hypothetical protein